MPIAITIVKQDTQDMIDDGNLRIPNVIKADNHANLSSSMLTIFTINEELNPSILIEDEVNGIWRDDQKYT